MFAGILARPQSHTYIRISIHTYILQAKLTDIPGCTPALVITVTLTSGLIQTLLGVILDQVHTAAAGALHTYIQTHTHIHTYMVCMTCVILLQYTYIEIYTYIHT